MLYAKDKDVEDQVSNGEIFWRDPVTLVTKRLSSSEYYGLYNRSRHMGNAKLFYSDREKGMDASIRVIYRGPFGIGDIRGNIAGGDAPSSDNNGNGILDTHDFFVSGYALVNLSVAKTIPQGLRFQLGIDNLFNYTDPAYIPNQPGRIIYGSIGYSFSRKSISNQ